jgi:signal transduction histidine kinase
MTEARLIGGLFCGPASSPSPPDFSCSSIGSPELSSLFLICGYPFERPLSSYVYYRTLQTTIAPSAAEARHWPAEDLPSRHEMPFFGTLSSEKGARAMSEVANLSRIAEDDADWTVIRESLRESQRLAVAGQFAATIMHEINNPLEAIANLNFLLYEDAADVEIVRRYSKQIEEQLAVLVRIARQTLSYYRPPSEKKLVVALALTEAALRIHQKGIAAKRIRLNVELADDLTIEAHPGEMLQVLSNLIGNALDALPVEGALFVRGRRSHCAIHLLVADGGHGIPSSIAPRIFDPFVTTKAGKGTGLGLAISKAIVEKHQGQIRTRSSTRPGRSGTAFRISLPLPQQAVAS